MAHNFKIAGDMDAAAMKLLRPELERLADTEDDVVIDMSSVEFIDSSGVGGIVFLYKRLLSAQKKLRLEKLKGQPKQLLTHLRLAELLAN